MSLQDEVNAILNNEEMAYDDKKAKLSKLMTPYEVIALLPEPIEEVSLKEPLKPKGENMLILKLALVTQNFEDILNGTKLESRAYSEFYKKRCTYEENGVRYLKPFDAITFYVGRSKRVRRATVALTNIVCDGGIIYFYLGDILDVNDELKVLNKK